MQVRRQWFLAAAVLVRSVLACSALACNVFGQSDLSGYWSNRTLTPLQRPTEFAGKPFFTPAEAAAYERKVIAESRLGNNALNGSGWDNSAKVVSTLRTSLIIDPPNGRLPQLTQGAYRRAGEARAARRDHPADGPEDRSLSERCLLWPAAGPPMLPSDNKYEILQTPDSVIIVSEMMHDTRVIPLDGRPHLPLNVRQWLGDSRGHWEGDTLVVETANFTDRNPVAGSSKDMRLTERFTRTAPATILYQFTVHDPAAFAAPWTAEIPMHAAQGPLAEYACQENNEGLLRILSGARAEEAKTKEAEKSQK
jgi:hypothetical protein